MLLAVLGRLVKESGSWAVTPIITDPVQRLFNFLIHTYCLEEGTVSAQKGNYRPLLARQLITSVNSCTVEACLKVAEHSFQEPMPNSP